MVIRCRITVLADQRVSLGRLKILTRHLGDKLIKAGARHPSELFASLAGIAEQRIDFGRPEIPRVDGDNRPIRPATQP